MFPQIFITRLLVSFSIFLFLFLSSLNAQYCTPSGNFSACALTNDFWITSVSFSGTGSAFNYSGGNCVTPSPYYLNTGYSGSLVAGNTYNMEISRAGQTYLTYFNVWADWNNNGILNDVNEQIGTNMVLTASGGLTATVSVTVPPGVVAGSYRLRVRVQYNVTTTNPCLTSGQAETKDFTITMGGGCPTPNITASGPLTICTGDSVTLTSNYITGNVWSNSATSQSITVYNSGSFSVYAIAGACTTGNAIPAVVSTNPTPPMPSVSAGGPTLFCVGDSVILTSSSTSGNIWSNAANTQSISASISGVYNVYVVSTGCTSLVSPPLSVNVVQHQNNFINVSQDTFCGVPATVLFSDSSVGSPVSWAWDFEDGSFSATQNPTHVFVNPGVFDVILIIYSTCWDTDTLTIIVLPAPAAPSITQTGAVLTANPPATAYQWFLNGNSIPGANSQSFSPLQSGNYSVEVSDTNGCTSTTSAGFVFTETEDNFSEGFSIFPNPNRGLFFVQIKGNRSPDSWIEIEDVQGRNIHKQALKPEMNLIQMESASPGLYFIIVNGRAAGKLVLK